VVKCTDRKYALSPGPSCFSPLICFAYGGPHARVSSPRVGCSILMTSALVTHLLVSCEVYLSDIQFLGKCIILDVILPTRGLRVFVYNTAGQMLVLICTLTLDKLRHTPASTLVISSTRIPANGNVGETASAAVARPRHMGQIEPLKGRRSRKGLDKP
jgi:hypothetical protein